MPGARERSNQELSRAQHRIQERDDSASNGLVTLQEAYEYAYAKTVASTMPNLFGTQHPTFEYNLSGTGNLVLTRLTRSVSLVIVEPGVKRAYLFISAKQGVVAEVWSDPVKLIRLSLPAGLYEVLRRDDDETYVAQLQVYEGGEVHVAALGFRKATVGLALAKGSLIQRKHELAINYGIIAYGPGELGPVGDIGLGYMHRGLRWSWGTQLNYGASRHTLSRSNFDADQATSSGTMAPRRIPYQMDRLSLSGQMLRRIALGFSEISLGLRLGAMGVRQGFGDQDDWGLGPAGFGVLGADVPLASWLSLRLSWSAGGILMKVGDRHRLRPEIQSSIGFVVFFR